MSSARKLPRSFYARPVLTVARDLIGKVLVHRSPEGEAAGRIVEAEAYRGPEDLAAHSAGGRRTKRTEAMFGPAGHAYIFRLYGVCWAFNAVAAGDGEPHAVLIRAIEPIHGLELMSLRRNKAPGARDLTNGPGKLCQALGLTGAHYGADLCGDVVFLTEGTPPRRTGRSARINIDYAGPWATKPWRFFESGSRFVSVPPQR